MLTTKNYNLEKPDAAEVTEVGYFNRNVDVIDQTLKDMDDSIKEHSTNLSHIPYAVATGSANVYEVTITPAPTAYSDGLAVRVKINATSTGASTLNVNGLGAKAIKDCYGNNITGSGLKENTPYIMCYESVSQSFIVQGKGGGGNATADEILDGVTATVDSGPITGTMPNNKGISKTLDINDTFIIPKGYHDGTGKVTQNIPTKQGETFTPGTSNQIITSGQYLSGDQVIEGDADLIPKNIKAGVSIFGVEGESSIVETSDGTATENEILDGYTAYVKGTKVTGAMQNNGAVSEILDINGTYAIPKGYHDGTGKVTQNIPTKAAETFTPGTTDQTIALGQYLSGDQTILGDASLTSDNIKAGASIFGVPGKPSIVDTADATAEAGDVLSGKTVYVNGSKKTGSMPNNGAISQALPINGSYTIPAGYHNGSGNITQSIKLAKPDYGDQMLANNLSCGPYSGDGRNYAYLGVPNGQYLAGVNWVRSLQPDLLAANIVSGKTIFGVTGTANIASLGGRRYVSGSEQTPISYDKLGNEYFYNKIVQLGFKPSFVLVYFVSGIEQKLHTYSDLYPAYLKRSWTTDSTSRGAATFISTFDTGFIINTGYDSEGRNSFPFVYIAAE